MPQVSIKNIVKSTSEAANFPASNLLVDKTWLTCPKENVEKVVIEFTFENAVQIHYIDIGYINISSMEVYVGSSLWSPSKNYLQLVPAVVLQNAIDARTGKNKEGCKMLNFQDHMTKDIGKMSWKNVRLVLRQPHARNKQLGLKFVRFGTPRDVNTNVTTDSKVNQVSDDSISNKSPFFKMMHTIMGSNGGSGAGMGRRFSDCGSSAALSRTEKMLLASKSSTPNSKSASSHARFSEGSSTPACNKVQSPRSNKEIPKTPSTNSSYSHKASPSANPKNLNHKSESPCSNPSNPKKWKFKSLNFSDKTSLNESESKNRINPTFKESAKTAYCSKPAQRNNPISRQHLQKHNTYTSESKAKDNVVPKSALIASEEPRKNAKNSHHNDAELIMNENETQEPVFTAKQIKQLKKAINRFFNAMDMDAIDLATIKIKDLRKQFEVANDVKLNRNGRIHFRGVTANFVNLVRTRQSHKQTAKTSEGSKLTPVKRKSFEMQSHSSRTESFHQSPSTSARNPTPTKMPRYSTSNNVVQMVECPLCSEMFSSSVIETHAAVCGETSNPQASSSTFNELAEYQSSSAVDCSESSCLTPVEQMNWIKFSKEPKPYQGRLNTSDYAGCMLMKCPSCGQKYKSTEIQEHSDECAEKVNSKSSKMGLYFTTTNNNSKKSKKTASKRRPTEEVYVLD